MVCNLKRVVRNVEIMKFRSKKREKSSLKFVLAILMLVIVFVFVYQYTRIKVKKEEIQEINNQILVQESKNNEILDILNSRESAKNNNPEDTKKGSVRVFEGIIR